MTAELANTTSGKTLREGKGKGKEFNCRNSCEFENFLNFLVTVINHV